MIVAVAVLGGLVTVGPVSAASEKKQVDRITCEEFLAMEFDRPIATLVDDCKATPKETLWQKLKKHI
jgi:hypothetical protein